MRWFALFAVVSQCMFIGAFAEFARIGVGVFGFWVGMSAWSASLILYSIGVLVRSWSN